MSLFGVISAIGRGLAEWIMGDDLRSDVTFNPSSLALHVIEVLLLLLVVLHLGALREVGGNHPDGIDIEPAANGNCWTTLKPADSIPFHPYDMVKDLVGVCILLLAAFVIFFASECGGLFLEYGNFVEANRLVTPEDIKLVWYYAVYYAMLRLVRSKYPWAC